MIGYLQHFALALILSCIPGWKAAAWFMAAIELTQAEYGGHYPWKKSFWKRLFTKDTFFDLIADVLGILVGQWLKIKLLSGL